MEAKALIKFAEIIVLEHQIFWLIKNKLLLRTTQGTNERNNFSLKKKNLVAKHFSSKQFIL